MVDQYQQEVSEDVNVEAVEADVDADADVVVEVTVLVNAWEDQFAVVGFNDVDMDAGELEGNLVQIELMDF